MDGIISSVILDKVEAESYSAYKGGIIMPKPFKVFVSYSHNDMALRKELDKHLRALKDENIISVRTDSDISPGTEWETQSRVKLNNAQVILLLISAEFMDSSSCRSVEMVS